MKKTFLTLVIIAMIAVSVFALVSCKEDEEVFDGKDEYGRSFGEIYDIDSESTGVFRLPYQIGDTSTMGQMMIEQYCADYAEIEKTQSGYKLTFYCDDGMLDNVSMTTDGTSVSGTQKSADDYQGFTFEVEKQDLESKITLSCVVKLMNRAVSFSIAVDLTQAKLVG